MLEITLNNGKSYSWHTGMEFPLNYDEIALVAELQADSDELESILTRCKNIPVNNRRVIRWFGDHAKFIAASLQK